MDFLRNLFSGGQPKDDAYVVYVRPKMCKKILEVRVDLKNQLSQEDDGNGYWVRKVVNNPYCPFEAEVKLYFDKNKKETAREIENGEFVSEADYLATQTQD